MKGKNNTRKTRAQKVATATPRPRKTTIDKLEAAVKRSLAEVQKHL